MSRVESFREYAAECVRQAETEPTPEDKNLLLNMALAWIRLAQQATPADESETPAGAAPPPVAAQTAAQAATPLS